MASLDSAPFWILCSVILVIVGLIATVPRTISIYRLLILPAFFTLLNLAWLTHRIHERFSLLPMWGVGIFLGILLGRRTVLFWKVLSDHNTQTIGLPGSWSTLVLIALTFTTRSLFLYQYENGMKWIDDPYFFDALLSGIFTGVFVGRSLKLFQKYQEG